MVVDPVDRNGERPRVLLLAAVVGAVASLIAAGSAALSTGHLGRPGSWVLTVTALAVLGAATLRRTVVRWWWAAGFAAATIGLFAPASTVRMAPSVTLSPTESTLELLWLAAALALVVGILRAADRRDTSRLRVSRLDGGLVAVSAATVLLLTALPSMREADAGSARTALLIAHAVIFVVALAAAIRHLLVTHHDRHLAFGVLFFALTGLVRSWACALGDTDLAGLSIVGAALALAALGLAVPLHQPPPSLVGRRTDVPNERVPLVGLCGLAPPFVALVQSMAGIEIDGVVLAAGMTVVLLLVAARLHLVIGEVREAAARDALVRQTTARIAAAREPETVSSATMEAVTTVMGSDLRFAGWVSTDRRSGYTVSHFSSHLGDSDPLRSGIYSMLDAREGSPDLEFVPVREGNAAILTVIEHPWQGFAVCCEHEFSLETLELLPTMATQAAMAIEGIGRENELLQRRSEARFEELVRHTTDAVVIVDGVGVVQYQTPSVVRLLGYLVVDLDGAVFRTLVGDGHHDAFDQFLRRLVGGAAQRGEVVDLTLNRADGGTVEVEIVGSNLTANPDVNGVVLTIRDVTRHRELEGQLRHQAFHDGLTGLANRALFVERLDHSLTVNRRLDGPAPAVAFIDLDDFKDVNDTLGHAAGDELLKTIATRIDDCVRVGDTPARFGGDEFAVLFEHADSPAALIEACERLLDALHEPVAIGDEVVRVRASIGLATRQDGTSESGEILRCADLAMYAAKAAGKGCVERFAPEMHEAMIAQLTSNNELEKAVRHGDLRVEYQPIVDLETDEVSAFEALVRWDHPTRGPVAPAEFIPLAEAIGCIDELGEGVLRIAVAQVAEWTRRVAHPVSVHVNISARQLEAPGFVDGVAAIVSSAGIDPGHLVLEIAESVLVGDGVDLFERLTALRGLGVRIAVDDFGTGFSSLRYLQQMPFDLLKIDRSFVSSLSGVTPEETLVGTILDLADRLGVIAIAEGVERPAERDGLRQLGCALGQGYLYGRAVTADEATEQLDQRVLRPVTAIA